MPRLRRSNYLSVTACMHPFPSEPHVKFGSRRSCANYHIKTEPSAATSIDATGKDKKNIVLLYTVPLLIVINHRNLYHFKGTCTIHWNLYRNQRLNIGLIHPSVDQCTAPTDQFLSEPPSTDYATELRHR